MAGTKTSADEYQQTIDLYHELGSTAKVGLELGISESQARKRLRKAGIVFDGKPRKIIQNPPIEFPNFPKETVDAEEIIAHQIKQFTIRKASHDAHTWFPVTVRDNLPIGILWYGDPHVDDNGCNWPVLKKHTDLCAKTEGLFGANIGDTTNNWTGRLLRLYANQDSSVKTARQLAKWFMLESGVHWIVWLLGNHDTWNDGAEVLAQMAKQHGTQKIVCHEWEARFVLRFPNGADFRIFAAHDHPGNSMWNPLHGQVRAAKFGAGVDLAIAGHRHNWGISQWEMPEQRSVPLMIRVRGYKHMDDHARTLGIQEQEEGQGILTIFNPLADTRAGRLISFADVDAGVDFLKFIRDKAKRKARR